MLGRIIKLIIGILLLPVVCGASVAFIRLLGNIQSAGYPSSQFFIWGVAAYIFMHLFLFKAQYLYNVGHEAAHALATWLCGGRVTSFRVSKEGGAVGTTKTNFFISLAPYFFPFYTLIISLFYFIVSFFCNMSYLSSYFLFLVGFALALHVISTVEIMRMEQPDILRTGYVFSITLIYIVNIVLIAFIVSLLFKELSFEFFFSSSYDVSKNIYIRVFKQLFWV